MLTCGCHRSVADGDAENKDKARDLVDLESSNNNAKVREGVARPCLTFSQVQSARNRLVGSAADPGDEGLFLKNGR